MSYPDPFSVESIDATAAAWLARLDRGLTPTEQDEYLHWRSLSPRHAAAVDRLEKSWVALDSLAAWRPAHSPQPNPDLLVVARTRRRWILTAVGFAAAFILIAALRFPTLSVHPQSASAVRPGPNPAAVVAQERRVLEDGSVVELSHGSDVVVIFSAAERRVALVQGEAFFTVAHQPDRPFIVQAGDVSIRAVGTAFNVRLASDVVEVLVTEGKVHVDPATPGQIAHDGSLPLVVAGQRAIIGQGPNSPRPVVVEASAAQIATSLAWQSKRLEFVDTPLSLVVAEFNRHGSPPLVIADHALGDMRMGGSFRADNLDAFVRLLENGFGVRVERHADRVVLHRAP